MQQLKNFMRREQVSINQTISQQIGELPKSVRPVAEHLFSSGGKRVRPLLALLCGRLFGCFDDSLYSIGSSIEMLHSATLLHDDILDHADIRRGQPAAHIIYDRTKVILAGDIMLASALQKISSYGDARMTGSLSDAVLQTASGQIAEHESLYDISLPYEEYLSIITGKTAWLLRTSCELGAFRAGANENHVRSVSTFGLNIGIAFQLVDDALDVSSSSETGKPCGGDILEGKITPPFLFYLNSLNDKERAGVAEIFCSGKMKESETVTICSQIREKGFQKKTRELAEEYIQKSLDALATLPDAEEKNLLQQMAQYIIRRAN